MGILVVFLYHHLRRSHLEGAYADLHPADNRRHGALLSWQMAMGWCRNGVVHSSADTCQPRTDVLLLPAADDIHRRGIPRRCRREEEDDLVGEGYGRGAPGWYPGHCGKRAQPVSHLRIQQTIAARSVRAHTIEGKCSEGYRRRPRPRLYHTMELRHRRKHDIPHPRL